MAEGAVSDSVDQAAAPALFEKPARRMPWGVIVLTLVLSAAAFGYMHRDELTVEVEQFKKYLLRGTPAAAMSPEEVASAQAAAEAASASAAASAQAALLAASGADNAAAPADSAASASSLGSVNSVNSVNSVASAAVETSAPSASAAAPAVIPAVTASPASVASEPVAKEVKTNKKNKPSDETSDVAWVKKLTDNSFVLQLSAADTEEDILKFKRSHPVYADARVMSAPKKDSKKRYFILVAGPFENKTQADNYVNSHPLLSKGWLRNAKSMRNQFLKDTP